MFTDSHSHYDDNAFLNDKDELLKSMHENNVDKIITVGCDVETSKNSVAISKQYDFVYSTVGFHPNYSNNIDNESLDELIKLSKCEKVVAWGEIGLDYFYDEPPKELQKEGFARQLDIAKELSLPVCIHSRDATKDTLDILKKYDITGVFHCFSGSVEVAREILNMGMYISFAGIVTFKNANNVKQTAQYVPSDRYLIETDCPYLSPTPNRGKRNDSRNLIYTAGEIAILRNTTVETVAMETSKNAQTLFNLK